MNGLKRSKIAELLRAESFDIEVKVSGWIRTLRTGKKFSFLELNDGSSVNNLQVVIDNGLADTTVMKSLGTGGAITLEGVLVKSQGKEQAVELQYRKLEVHGLAPENYPMQKKAHTLEFLREVAHLRPRTATFSSVLRIRHSLAFAVHQFFHERGFYYVQTPIITASDTEGAGEMFSVTTLPLNNVPKTTEGDIDYSKDFFARKAHLTVSGQLEGELAALALGEVYTFGPTFRAENSNTTRHLAEFWMIEPEMAFYDLNDNMALAEEFLKYLIRFALEHNAADLKFLTDTYDPELKARLDNVVSNDFVRLDYTEGVEILKNSGRKFEFPVDWGTDLQSEHERYLVEDHFSRPVILVNYPKQIKAFYMRQNEDGKTVRAMDVLFPGIGEIIGGSQREERLELLEKRIQEMGLPIENYWWYLDTRRYGTVPHAGFGMGFERLVQFVTGMGNIRDVIPFPRYPGNAEF